MIFGRIDGRVIFEATTGNLNPRTLGRRRRDVQERTETHAQGFVVLPTGTLGFASAYSNWTATTTTAARNRSIANSNATPKLGEFVELLKEQGLHFQGHVVDEVTPGVVPHGIAKDQLNVRNEMLEGIVLAHDRLRMHRP